MVRARAVVRDTAAKLGEHEQQHVVAGLMVPAGRHEGIDADRHIRPQFVMRCCLIGMRVKAVVRRGGVQNPGAKIGQMRLGNVFHILADRRVGVRHVDAYFGGAVASTSAPFRASVPVRRM